MLVQGLRQRAGYVVITDPGAPGGKIEHETYQCCHCNAHFTREVGKGPPAMCLRCMKATCGKKKCDPCQPFEAWLEAMEGRRKLWRQMEIPT